MMKKNILIMVILVIVVAVGGFFAGTKYQQSKISQTGRQRGANFPGNRGGQGSQRTAGGMVRGEILNKENGTITVKLQDQSTKLVLVTEKTSINKAAQGTIDDLETGKQVMVFGQENSDKSISATNIQLDFGFRGETPAN